MYIFLFVNMDGHHEKIIESYDVFDYSGIYPNMILKTNSTSVSDVKIYNGERLETLTEKHRIMYTHCDFINNIEMAIDKNLLTCTSRKRLLVIDMDLDDKRYKYKFYKNCENFVSYIKENMTSVKH